MLKQSLEMASNSQVYLTLDAHIIKIYLKFLAKNC